MHALALPPSTHHPSLPSSSSNSESSTPVPSGSSNDPKKKPTAKRKRTADSMGDNDSGSQPRTRDGPKKKKANRACFHCQKAHLTCDDCEYRSPFFRRIRARTFVQPRLLAAREVAGRFIRPRLA